MEGYFQQRSALDFHQCFGSIVCKRFKPCAEAGRRNECLHDFRFKNVCKSTFFFSFIEKNIRFLKKKLHLTKKNSIFAKYINLPF